MSSIADQIDPLFAPYDRPDSPGCALGIVRGGEMVYARGYGAASLDYGLLITPATVFHLASMSKQFTAFALLLLAAEGKLSLDDEARRYISALPAFDEEREAGPITLRHLLHHTSGLRDQFGLALTGHWRAGDVLTTGDILGLLARQRELNFPPGSEMMYCNTGYTLLGLAVERVAGRPLREFLAERVFGPLGMARTRVHDDPTTVVRDRACPYGPAGVGPDAPREVALAAAREGREFALCALLSLATAGTSGVYSTVLDLARWDENFYSGAVGGAEVVARMAQPGLLRSGRSTGYGGGLWMGTYRGLCTVEHDGEDGGYRCDLLRFPDQHLSVILLGNVSALDHTGLCRRVADVILAEAFTAPVPAPSADAMDSCVIPPSGGSGAPGEYAGDYGSPELDARCSFLPHEGLLILLRPKHDPVPFAPAGPDRFAAGPAEVRFTRGKAGQIIGFRVDFQGVRNLWYEKR